MLQEIGREDKQVFAVKGVSYIEERPGLDLAFLEVEQIDGTIAKPIGLSTSPAVPTPLVATIGYPAFDSRIPEPDLMKQIYGDVYDKKRLAPGAITEVDEHARAPQLHDARRQLGIGRHRSEERRGARASLQRQLPAHQLRGARGIS